MQRTHALLTAAGVGAGLAAWALGRKTPGYDLHGKVVLITGGSRGLGLQLAREFGSQGARIVICARDAAELERARLDLQSRGVVVHAIRCDITQREQVFDMVREAGQVLGPVDVLVNNAGVIQVGPLDDMTIGSFEYAMSVIFWGALYTSLAVLPEMRARRQGRIVNITSIGGKVPVPHLLPYSCAKFAAVALSEGMRTELKPSGVKVVTIVPGLMRTGSHLQAEFSGHHEREFAWFSLGAATPLISIDATRAARSIVQATRRGDAEKILSVPADLLARFHGVFPEMTSSILTLVNRLLPSATGGESGTHSGHAASQDLNSHLLDAVTTSGRKAAAELNEMPGSLA